MISSREALRKTSELLSSERFKKIAASVIAASILAGAIDTLRDNQPTEPTKVTVLSEIDTLSNSAALEQETQEDEISQEHYKSSRINVTMNGMGRNTSCYMAQELQKVTRPYGREACLEYNAASLDADEITLALESLLQYRDEETGKLTLNFFVQSAGGKILALVNDFIAKHKDVVDTEYVATQDGPFDASDIRGAIPQFLVNNSQIIPGGPALLNAMQVYSLQQVENYPRINAKNWNKVWEDAYYNSKDLRVSGIRAQLRIIKDPMEDISDIASLDPRIYNLIPVDPLTDPLVDAAQANEKFRSEYEDKYGLRYETIYVNSKGHANLIHDPETADATREALAQICRQSIVND